MIHFLRLLGTTEVTLSLLLKHNFWSVKGYLKNVCNKKKKMKKKSV